MRAWRLIVCTACVFVTAWVLLPIPPAWVESVYSRGLYRGIAAVLVTVSGALPFSVSGVLLILAPIAFLLVFRRAWRRRRTEGMSRKRAFLWGPKAVLVLAVLCYAAFILLWGAGYRRPPIEERLRLTDTPVSAADVDRLSGAITALIRRDLDRGIERDQERAAASLRRALGEVVREWDGSEVTLPARVKALPAGTLYAFGVSGITSPLLLEAHVDGGATATTQLAVGTHELAHVAGLCGEADADLACYFAGLRADDPFARYAVALSIFARAHRATAPKARKALWETLPPTAQQDLRAAVAARQRYEIGVVSRISSRVYDSYLKSQGVAKGVEDYGRSLSLLIRSWRTGLVQIPPP